MLNDNKNSIHAVKIKNVSTVLIVDNGSIISEIEISRRLYSTSRVAELTNFNLCSYNEEKEIVTVDLTGDRVLKPQLALIEFAIRNLLQKERYVLKEISVGSLSAIQLNDATSNKSISYKGSFIRWILDENVFSNSSQLSIPWDCDGTQTHALIGLSGLWKLKIEDNELKDIVKLSDSKIEITEGKLILPCSMGDLVFDLTKPIVMRDRQFNDFIINTISNLLTKQYRY